MAGKKAAVVAFPRKAESGLVLLSRLNARQIEVENKDFAGFKL